MDEYNNGNINQYKKPDVGTDMRTKLFIFLLILLFLSSTAYWGYSKLGPEKIKNYINNVVTELLDENTTPSVPKNIPTIPLDNTANDFWDNPQT